MDAKFRLLYLLAGSAGLVYLFYYLIASFPNVDPAHVLVITIPDMLFFFLAYRTYPGSRAVVEKRSIVMQEHNVVMQESRVRVNG
ncbi:hypothetical protein JN11_01188 [Mucilaginibacter frigoritolerans]|uniref:Uncharacterized protein n=1 Tax=Mucilaginibacter frigoritolerans TaxID=652788 RepID=A0A562U8W2_9SPHI|nr:hypothetical protein [Mucilaginibacter frigoritolerans]TWJ02216.1 hypothetical protein JN11_01188 [Mucilaginibacter frigoritolerans]